MAKMSRPDAEKLVKRINQRYVDIVNTFGKDSAIAQQWASMMNQTSTAGISKSGNVKVGKAGKLTETDYKILNKLNKFHTRGTRKEYLSQTYNQGQKINNKKARELEKKHSKIKETIEKYKDALYDFSPSLTQAIRRSDNLTPDEVDRLYDFVNKYDGGDIEEIATLGEDVDDWLDNWFGGDD